MVYLLEFGLGLGHFGGVVMSVFWVLDLGGFVLR